MAYRKQKAETSSGVNSRSKPTLHERVTQRIVGQLRAGTPPWVKPWNCNGSVGMPRNYVSGRPYSGINVLLTWIAALEHGFKDTRYLTANQIIELGGSFKGQKATRIVFAKEVIRKPGSDDEDTFFVGKLYNVFNAEQVSGVALEPEDPLPPFEARVPELEAFIAAQGVAISHGGDRAFYKPSRDAIVVPHPGTFTSPEGYYAVVLHELAHASEHPSRLNCPGGPRDTPVYWFNELRAELTSAMLCAEFGLPECAHHAGYLAHYIELLNGDPGDPKAIFSAARQASQAATFLGEQAQRAPELAAAA